MVFVEPSCGELNIDVRFLLCNCVCDCAFIYALMRLDLACPGRNFIMC